MGTIQHLNVIILSVTYLPICWPGPGHASKGSKLGLTAEREQKDYFSVYVWKYIAQTGNMQLCMVVWSCELLVTPLDNTFSGNVLPSAV